MITGTIYYRWKQKEEEDRRIQFQYRSIEATTAAAVGSGGGGGGFVVSSTHLDNHRYHNTENSWNYSLRYL